MAGRRVDADPAPPATPAAALVADLLSRCTFPPAGTAVTCAFSGGADSTALVVLALAAGCDVVAVHVDHRLRPTSGAEAARAVAVASALQVSCRVIEVDVGDGPNVEARARDARREVLPADALTGHTADDRAATLLINLLRGAGLDGLTAMGPSPTRPILDLRRTDTERVCAALGIDVVSDPSNAHRRFVRNRVRDELVPLMADIAGRDVVPLLVRTATVLADDGELADAHAAGLDATDARMLATIAPSLARRVVRGWLTGAAPDGHPPTSAVVERVLDVARGTHRACEIDGGRRVERHRQRLRIVMPAALASNDGMNGTGEHAERGDR
ncbi:MAG: tRNA lysidine(34) synthetase TilS [Ilumatobacteraceae bacterium]